MTIVFISVASKGAVTDGKLNEAFLKNMAAYHMMFPDIVFMSPMINGYAVLPYMPRVEATYDIWGRYCEKMLAACDEVWVLQLPGWESSTGVKGEMSTHRL